MLKNASARSAIECFLSERKCSRFNMIGVSYEIQRCLPKQSWVFVRKYERNIFRFDFWDDDVFVCIYEMEQSKLKVERCFAFLSNRWGRQFDLFTAGRSHLLLSECSLSFNNIMITLTSARLSARIVELTSGTLKPKFQLEISNVK